MKTFSEWLLNEERKIPTKDNTYKDDEGVLRWKSNHHKVKYFGKSKENSTLKNTTSYRYKKIKDTHPYDFQYNLENGKYTSFIEKLTNIKFSSTEELNDWMYSTDDGGIGVSGYGIEDMIVFHNRRMKLLSEELRKYKIDEEDYIRTVNKKLKEYTSSKNTILTSRHTSEKTLKILESGRFKSQFETDESSGNFTPSLRGNIELIGQNIPYTEDVKNRPIYGSLKHKNYKGEVDLQEYTSDKCYGNCIFIFNDKLRSRTTITFGDSFDNALTSSPLDNPDISSIAFKDYKLNDYKHLSEDDIRDMFMSKSRQNEYPEIQITGGVSINDVSYVIIDGETKSKDTISVINKLKELNIPFEIKENDNV